jgi:hypothetical protein
MGLPDLKKVFNGGIMDDSTGTNVTERDIENILRSPVNVVSGVEPGQNGPNTDPAAGVCSPQEGGCGPGGGVGNGWGDNGKIK